MRPPGGFETFEVGRSVNTLKEFVVLEEAKALLETRVLVLAEDRALEAYVFMVVFSGIVDASFASTGSGVGFSLVAAFFSFSVPLLAFAVVFVATEPLALASRISFIRFNSASVYPPRVI